MEKKLFWWFDEESGQLLETKTELNVTGEPYEDGISKKEERVLGLYGEFPTGDQYLPQGEEDFSL